MQTVAGKDFLQFFSGFSVKFRICVIIRIIDKRKGYDIESRVKCGVDQVGMHGDLYRVSVHQCLDSFRLVSIGQLICSINIDFNLASGCFFHQLTKFTAAVCPGACLCCGACKVPGCFRPVKVTVVCHSICRFFCKEIDQFLCIIISFFLEFLNKPLTYAIYGFFEGIDVHVFFLCDSHAIL